MSKCISVTGPSGSGKSTWVYNVMKNKNIIFDDAPKYTFLFYSHKQDLYDIMSEEKINFKAIQKFPTYSELRDLIIPYKKDGTAVIFDDALFHLNEQTARVFLEL